MKKKILWSGERGSRFGQPISNPVPTTNPDRRRKQAADKVGIDSPLLAGFGDSLRDRAISGACTLIVCAPGSLPFRFALAAPTRLPILPAGIDCRLPTSPKATVLLSPCSKGAEAVCARGCPQASCVTSWNTKTVPLTSGSVGESGSPDDHEAKPNATRREDEVPCSSSNR